MIRRCSEADLAAIEAIVNDAARAYRGVIPPDQWHEPYMPRAAVQSEIDAGVEFRGWEDASGLVGVMGLQDVKDVTLIRHAYVRSDRQGSGVGSALIEALVAEVKRPLLVGTWAAAHWAIRFYERHHFRRVSDAEKDRLLQTYWKISARQRETSVVLAHEPRAPQDDGRRSLQ